LLSGFIEFEQHGGRRIVAQMRGRKRVRKAT
jgi:hypothetical protein